MQDWKAIISDCSMSGGTGTISFESRYFSMRRMETRLWHSVSEELPTQVSEHTWSMLMNVSGRAFSANFNSLKTAQCKYGGRKTKRLIKPTNNLMHVSPWYRRQAITLTAVNAMEGVRSCLRITAKCQKDTRVTRIGVAFLFRRQSFHRMNSFRTVPDRVPQGLHR